jgi:hypothetical protein
MTKKKKWIIIGSIVAGVLVIGSISSLGGEKPSEPPVAETPAEPATPAKSAEPVEEPEVEPVKKVEETPSGLGRSWAATACNNHLESVSKYGAKATWMFGTYLVQEDTMILKTDGWAKNAYGTKEKLTFECTVSGTDGSPVVDSFLHY